VHCRWPFVEYFRSHLAMHGSCHSLSTPQGNQLKIIELSLDAQGNRLKIFELSLHAEGNRVPKYFVGLESFLQNLASFKFISWKASFVNPYCITIRTYYNSHNRSTRRQTLSILTHDVLVVSYCMSPSSSVTN
jgi:hypothetical protein